MNKNAQAFFEDDTPREASSERKRAPEAPTAAPAAARKSAPKASSPKTSAAASGSTTTQSKDEHVISEHSRNFGEITDADSVVVRGYFEGSISCNRLLVSPKGEVIGKVIRAENVRIEGHFEGDIICTNLAVTRKGVVLGEVRAQEVKCAGTMKGKVVSHTAHFAKTSQADVLLEGVVDFGVEPGARLRAEIDNGVEIDVEQRMPREIPVARTFVREPAHERGSFGVIYEEPEGSRTQTLNAARARILEKETEAEVMKRPVLERESDGSPMPFLIH